MAEPCEAHPELGEQLDKMQKYMTTKLSDTEPFGVDFPVRSMLIPDNTSMLNLVENGENVCK